MSELDRSENARARLVAIVESSEEAIIAITKDGVISDWNEAAARLYGYSAKEAVGLNITTLVPPSRADEYTEIERTLAAGRRISQLETVRQRSDGSLADVSLSIAPIFDQDGVVIGSAGITRDITRRKQMEEALWRSEERFRLVTQATKDIIWDWDVESGRMWRSEIYWQHFGYPPPDVEPDVAGWKDMLHPEDRDRVWTSFQTALRRRSTSYEVEYRFRKSDGSYAVVLDRALIVYDETGKPIRAIGALSDLSNQRLLEEQLRQAVKMEAVGQLAGAVAHDFNNLLMGISSHTELLMMTTDPRQAEERARTILSAIESAGQLTKKLLAFSRIQELATSTFDLNQLVAETHEFIGRLLPEIISVDVRLSAVPCWVNADRVQMEQTLINLVLNARDAMPEGGRLVLSTCHIDADDLALHDDVPSGTYALISVADTGHGIPEQHLEKILEPFFTTKPKEHGTGLGLSIAYGIVTQSGGHIRVKSTVGSGTTFTIYIPSGEPPQVELPKRTPCPLEISEASCPRKGTILVVEDEAIVRRSIRAYLELNGLTVIDCADASEALKLASELKEKLAMLITDVVMPDMTGIELARSLVKQMPELPIIFMSGYAAGEKGHEDFKHATFLQKPFACATMLDTVRKGLQIFHRREQIPN